MLEIWLSLGYILLLAILLYAFILWRTGAAVAAIAALVVGVPDGRFGNRVAAVVSLQDGAEAPTATP